MTPSILSYNPDRLCPKCEHPGNVHAYSEFPYYVRGQDGHLVSVARFSDPAHSHLIIRCVGCGWEWLSETSDAA